MGSGFLEAVYQECKHTVLPVPPPAGEPGPRAARSGRHPSSPAASQRASPGPRRSIRPPSVPTSMSAAVKLSLRLSLVASDAFPSFVSLYAATRRDDASARARGGPLPTGLEAMAPDQSLPRSIAATRLEHTPTAPGDDAWLPPES